ncbi:thiamine pyrophosphate-dependent enzyme [Pseudomonas akapageensis]|uniref:thiamine pyrophosphate-dependent enzyme n=1 Tax=Pseudomonas akapageensis TaxID=2609961 RepID=UPI0014082E5D
MKLSGSQIVAKALKAHGVHYVAGIPGYGSRALVDALYARGTEIPFIQVMQEQSAVHMADGYFRACGRPMAALLPTPLSQSRALGAIATALADGSAALVISGGEPDDAPDAVSSKPSRVGKDRFCIASIETLSEGIHHAFDAMLSGRAGPVNVGIPVCIQKELLEVAGIPAPTRIFNTPAVPEPASNDRTSGALCMAREECAFHLSEDWRSDASPLVAQRPLAELRQVLDRDAILVVGAGSIHAAVRQLFPVFLPRSQLCAGSVDAVGWAVPAAIGARLAMPARQVVCVVSDADFLQSMQEMAVCMMHTIPVVFMVFNNSGYTSLSDVRSAAAEHHPGIGFNLPDGKPYSPDFAVIAKSFGLEAWRVEHASQLHVTLNKALNSTGPALVEIITAREVPSESSA